MRTWLVLAALGLLAVGSSALLGYVLGRHLREESPVEVLLRHPPTSAPADIALTKTRYP